MVLRRYFLPGKGLAQGKGIVFNPNGQTLYASSSDSRHIVAVDISGLRIVPKYRFKDEDDKTAPLIYISQPANTASGLVNVSESMIKLIGSAIDESGVNLIKVNGQTTPIKQNGNFEIFLPLQMGDNFTTIEVEDINGNTSVKRCTIRRKELNGEKYDPTLAKNFLFIVGMTEEMPKMSPIRC